MATADVNGDGRPDTVTANLGSVAPARFPRSSHNPAASRARPEIIGVGSMFAIAVADFNNDSTRTSSPDSSTAASHSFRVTAPAVSRRREPFHSPTSPALW